jgi:hypothetical protein
MAYSATVGVRPERVWRERVLAVVGQFVKRARSMEELPSVHGVAAA